MENPRPRPSFAPPSDSMMWHYTDTAGALGMIQGKEFWASHAIHMNDTEELQQFFSNITSALTIQMVKYPSETVRNWIWNSLDEFMERLQVNYFVVSFSKEPDSLSQWRGYGGSGQGYALGFDRAAFLNIDGWLLSDCVYITDVAVDLANQIVREGLDAVNDGQFDHLPGPSRVRAAIYPRAIREAPALKHPAFSEERELRLIGGPFDGGLAKVRPGRRGMLPYVPLKWPTDNQGFYPLREIIAGPGASADTYHGVEMATQFDPGFKKFVQVYGSEAPYRA